MTSPCMTFVPAAKDAASIYVRKKFRTAIGTMPAPDDDER